MDTRPVLNVDDHAPARFLRTRILQRAGFGVDEGDSAAAAIERAPESSLLLLDVKLPDGDGFSVCEAVKRAAPSLPVVMVTSVYRTTQARLDAFAAGADAFLLEPIAPEQLVRTIETLIKRKGEPSRAIGEAWVLTDAVGDIQEISPEAARMLNTKVDGTTRAQRACYCPGKVSPKPARRVSCRFICVYKISMLWVSRRQSL